MWGLMTTQWFDHGYASQRLFVDSNVFQSIFCATIMASYISKTINFTYHTYHQISANKGKFIERVSIFT